MLMVNCITYRRDGRFRPADPALPLLLRHARHQSIRRIRLEEVSILLRLCVQPFIQCASRQQHHHPFLLSRTMELAEKLMLLSIHQIARETSAFRPGRDSAACETRPCFSTWILLSWLKA